MASLKRVKPLRPGSRLKRGKALRNMGARAKRQKEDEDAFKVAVYCNADWKCQSCGSTQGLHAHHIVPRSRGGKHVPSNGACLCFSCHSRVHDHTLEGWEMWVG